HPRDVRGEVQAVGERHVVADACLRLVDGVLDAVLADAVFQVVGLGNSAVAAEHVHLLGNGERTADEAAVQLGVAAGGADLQLGPAAFNVGVAHGIGSRGGHRSGGQQGGGQDEHLAHRNSL
ncbi:hypothetical protein B8W90_11475, partial [Staphylococcus hominis]